MSAKLTPSLWGKRVRLVDVDDEIFEGKVGDYIAPEDNEPEGIASIVLDDCPQRPGWAVEFPEPDIKSIEVID